MREVQTGLCRSICIARIVTLDGVAVQVNGDIAPSIRNVYSVVNVINDFNHIITSNRINRYFDITVCSLFFFIAVIARIRVVDIGSRYILIVLRELFCDVLCIHKGCCAGGLSIIITCNIVLRALFQTYNAVYTITKVRDFIRGNRVGIAILSYCVGYVRFTGEGQCICCLADYLRVAIGNLNTYFNLCISILEGQRISTLLGYCIQTIHCNVIVDRLCATCVIRLRTRTSNRFALCQRCPIQRIDMNLEIICADDVAVCIFRRNILAICCRQRHVTVDFNIFVVNLGVVIQILPNEE